VGEAKQQQEQAEEEKEEEWGMQNWVQEGSALAEL
jgi:hypothetical protein